MIAREYLIRDCLARCLSIQTEHVVLALSGVSEWISISTTRPAPALILLCFVGGYDEGFVARELALLAAALVSTPVVVMAEHNDIRHIRNAFACGARGYIPTSIPLDVALNALRVVQSGGMFAPASSMLDVMTGPDAGATRRPVLFTPRQASIVAAIRQGKANKQIAYELNLRESTIKVHVRALMRKLKARNRTEIAVKSNEI